MIPQLSPKEVFLWICQLVPAAILLAAAYGKLASFPNEVDLFIALGMEPYGRFTIGVIEAICTLSLVTRRFAAGGAVLGVGVMIGAFISHATVIGFVVQNDGGAHMIYLATVFLSCSIVAFFRRGEIPLIGRSLL